MKKDLRQEADRENYEVKGLNKMKLWAMICPVSHNDALVVYGKQAETDWHKPQGPKLG